MLDRFASVGRSGATLLHYRTRIGCLILALVALFLSLAALVAGHGIGIEELHRVFPNWPSMVPTTAAGMALMSLSTLGVIYSSVCFRFARAVSLVVILASAYLMLRVLDPTAVLSDGGDHVSYGTALCFMLAGIAQIARTQHEKLLPRLLLLTCSITVLTVCLVNLTILIINPEIGQQDAILSGMSFPTALCFTLLVLAQALDVLLMPNRTGEPVTGTLFAFLAVPASVLLPLGIIAVLLESVRLPGGQTDESRAFVVAALVIGLLLLNAIIAVNWWIHGQLSQSQEARLRSVIDAFSTAVFIQPERGGPFLLNNAAKALIGPETTGADWLSNARFHAPHSRVALAGDGHPIRRLERQDTMGEVYAAWVDERGSERFLRFSQTMTDAVTGWSAMRIIEVQDQTESWRTREVLSRAERVSEIGELASGLAHEMQNIFGVVRLASDLGRMLVTEGRAHEQFVAISRSCDRGARMTDQLLHLSRGAEDVTETLDLVAVMAGVVELGRANLPDSISLVADLPEGPLWVTCNPSALSAVTMEAILNARNAMTDAKQPVGTITLAIETGHLGEDFGLSTSHDIVICDDGPGMEADVLYRATQPYFTTRRAAGGSGLGLSVARQFALRTGGRLVLRSQPGDGSEFRLCLPEAKEEEVGKLLKLAEFEAALDHQALPDRIEADLPSQDLTGLTLLLAGAPEGSLEDLPRMLEMLGAKVSVADSVGAAVAYLEGGNRPDAVLISARLWGERTREPSALAIALTNSRARGVIHLIPPGRIGQPSQAETGLTVYEPVRLEILANAIRIAVRRTPKA